MIYAVIILGMIALIAVSMWSIDFYHYLTQRYSRYHIGKWSDDDKWKKAILHKALSWTRKTPTVKVTDNNRYLLLDVLQGKYRSNTIQSWQIGALLLGLSHMKTPECNAEVKKAIETIIDRKGMFVRKPTNVDCGLLSYAILKNSDPQLVKPAMDYAAELIKNHIASDGMISYVNDLTSDERYVDTLGLVCPFLALYASVYHIPEYSQLAIEQLRQFSGYGLEPCFLLPNHAYSTVRKLPLGVYGWGRGVGWYILGLIDTYQELDENEDKLWLRNQIRNVADKYRTFQRQDGGFGFIVQMQYGYDSSVTAVMAYFYRKCAELFNEDQYADIANRCIKKLRSVTRITGAIDWCQGDTKGIGVFAQTYDIMPFAQGITLRSL